MICLRGYVLMLRLGGSLLLVLGLGDNSDHDCLF